jgi:hypothetical protein
MRWPTEKVRASAPFAPIPAAERVP